ncbi:hypothetical protein AALO_G00139080 [Alosa alosa]|uniref:Uncharacterized protein n=1 Tax=Alosa alosa TaxID=278164 RepID=A0AAV6GJP1_9TELE|nr:hypothetical protein AALO_G00139080 [Alosa alosa]
MYPQWRPCLHLMTESGCSLTPLTGPETKPEQHDEASPADLFPLIPLIRVAHRLQFQFVLFTILSSRR